MGQLSELVGTRSDDLILVSLHNDAQPELERLLAAHDGEWVSLVTVPTLYRYALVRGGVNGFKGLPIISLSESPTVGWRGAIKRGSDLLVGLPMSLLALPVMAAVAVAIKLTSRGPALFHQNRVGRDGKVFRLVKFRTMTLNAEKDTGPVWARNHDPRCTRIGEAPRLNVEDVLAVSMPLSS